MDACGTCGRTLLELRTDLGIDALRGSTPLCAVPGCPLVQRVTGFRPLEVRGRELAGATPPAVFVGRHGYPRVMVGPLLAPGTSPEEAAVLGDVHAWSGKGIDEILSLRARLVRGRRLADVTKPLEGVDRVLSASREIAMADRPVETEVTLARPLAEAGGLSLAPALDGTAAPMGPGVEVLDARVTGHATVPRRVDAAVGDTHALAGDVMLEMYDAGIPLSHVQRVLSVGLLGEARRRRLVPTRWSITATDDTVGRALAARVRDLGEVDATTVHFAELHGNRFHVVLFPGPRSFEMHEAWEVAVGGRRSVQVAIDLEGPRGRSDYASNITGAYYAARLAVLERLDGVIRRQAGVLVLREITDAYWAPLGVWVIREGVRGALGEKGLVFGGPEDAWRYILRRARFPDSLPRPQAVAGARQRTLMDFGA